MNYRAVLHVEDAEHAPAAQGDAPVLLAPGSGGELVAHGWESITRLQAELGTEWLRRRPGDLHWNLDSRHTVTGAVLSLFEPWSTGAAVLAGEAVGPGEAVAVLERFPVTTVSAPADFYRALTGPDPDLLRRTALRQVLATDRVAVGTMN